MRRERQKEKEMCKMNQKSFDITNDNDNNI